MAPQEEGQPVLLLRDAPFEVRDAGHRRRERRAGAGRLEAGRGAGLQAAVEQVVRLLERCGGALRGLQLQIELAQLEVARRHVGDEREQHAAARLLAGQDLRPRRLVQPPDAAPQIDLPGDAEVDVIKVVRPRAGLTELRGLAARPAGAGLDLRQKLRAANAGRRPRLFNAPRREPHVVTVAERLVDQRLELAVLKDLPPGAVGERSRFGRAHLSADLLGSRDRRPLIVGTDGAAPNEQENGQEEGRAESERETVVAAVAGHDVVSMAARFSGSGCTG
jgi:hypothetical protein